MSINCKICGQKTTTGTVQVRSKKTLEIFHCNNCDFDFFDFNPENLLIEDKLDQSRLKAAGLDIPSIDEDFNNGIKQSSPLIESYFNDSDKERNILEIGCSWGYFLELIKINGGNPYGVELNKVRTKYVNEHLMIPCFGSLEECISQNIKFKKIYLFYVIEYVYDPLSYFKSLFSLLDDDGEIIFITPNLNDGLKDIWLNEGFRNFFYDECAINYFTPQTLKIIFNQIEYSNASIKSNQGYSFLNHVSWHFTNAPRTTGIVGGDAFLIDLKEKMDESNVDFSTKFYELIEKFNNQYKAILEENDYGNQIICRISRSLI
jgi:2-polyprenyl-3-methyl-5-hydroxy-6-metoxy-1,4-benzoquinol methylase